MAALLFYGYCRGIFSSRKMMAACEERLTCRVIVGDDMPNWRTKTGRETYAKRKSIVEPVLGRARP
jgi:hypothetical protein